VRSKPFSHQPRPSIGIPLPSPTQNNPPPPPQKTAIITNPLDVAKTQLQVQGELAAKQAGPGQPAAARLGMARTLFNLVRVEGPTALWRGVAPSMLREASYSTIRCVRVGLSVCLGILQCSESCARCGLSHSGVHSGIVGGKAHQTTCRPPTPNPPPNQVWGLRPHQVLAAAHPGLRLLHDARGAGGGGGGKGGELDAGDADVPQDHGGRDGGCACCLVVCDPWRQPHPTSPHPLAECFAHPITEKQSKTHHTTPHPSTSHPFTQTTTPTPDRTRRLGSRGRHPL